MPFDSLHLTAHRLPHPGRVRRNGRGCLFNTELVSTATLAHAAESIVGGAAVRATAIPPIFAAALVITWLSETAGRELEKTSALDSR